MLNKKNKLYKSFLMCVGQPLKECSILLVEQIGKLYFENHNVKYITKSLMLHTQSSVVFFYTSDDCVAWNF